MTNIYGYQDDVGLDRGEEKCFLGKFWRSSLLQISRRSERALCNFVVYFVETLLGALWCFVKTLWRQEREERERKSKIVSQLRLISKNLRINNSDFPQNQLQDFIYKFRRGV
jgi:hypothetical protein